MVFKIGDTHFLGISYALVFSIALFILLVSATVVYPPLLTAVGAWLIVILPILVPIVLFLLWWGSWVRYIRACYIAKQEPMLLEIKIPRQIMKTPRAMEQIFNALHFGPGESTFIAKWWDGKVRPWWSFELVSIEGRVHFYVWAWRQFRELIESQFYAQYPDIEIHEVEDYTAGIHFDPNTYNVWGLEWILSKPDAYPIKTYIDLELDKDVKKAEQIVDPISGVFEKLSGIGPGAQVWIQIVVRQNKGWKFDHVGWGSAGESWKNEAKAEIEKIYEAAKPQTKDVVTGEIDEGYPLLKPGEVNTIKALERSLEKPGFDAAIRGVYITRADAFEGHKIGSHVVSLWSTFSSGTLNSFRPSNTWHVIMDFPWQDFAGIRKFRFSRDVIDAYRRRAMFHPPYERPRSVLTSEELATIYHFPTEETKAPGIERLPSTKGEPPVNLPT